MSKIDIFAISRLKAYSDADGIFTLIGSAGCPLRCGYCLNPASWDNSRDIYSCSVDELYDIIKKDNLYFLSTNGGVIFGGGEPLLYHEFIKEFIQKYNDTGWTFALETSLSTNMEALKNIIDLIDLFIVDVKDMNNERYELYTRGSYEFFKNNLEYLLNNADSSKIHLRIPIIQGLHKDDEYKSSYNQLKSMGFENIEVFRYILPEQIKDISQVAIDNKNAFLNKLK